MHVGMPPWEFRRTKTIELFGQLIECGTFGPTISEIEKCIGCVTSADYSFRFLFRRQVGPYVGNFGVDTFRPRNEFPNCASQKTIEEPLERKRSLAYPYHILRILNCFGNLGDQIYV